MIPHTSGTRIDAEYLQQQKRIQRFYSATFNEQKKIRKVNKLRKVYTPLIIGVMKPCNFLYKWNLFCLSGNFGTFYNYFFYLFVLIILQVPKYRVRIFFY